MRLAAHTIPTVSIMDVFLSFGPVFILAPSHTPAKWFLVFTSIHPERLARKMTMEMFLIAHLALVTRYI